MDTEGTSELNVDYLDVIFRGPDEPQGSVQWTHEISRMYPNPLKAGQSLTIEPGNDFRSDCIVEIFNMNGRKVYQHQFSKIQGQLILDDLELEESMYILGVRSDINRTYMKLFYY
jgi:hypothetical protein